MKTKTLLTSLLALFLFTGAAMAEGKWYTDWDAAAKASKSSHKPILMDFTGSDWCGWCIRLKDEVFSTPEFQKWADKNVVLLEVDFPRQKKQSDAEKKKNQALAEKYNIEGFPTIIFAKPDGTAIGKYGYDEGGPANWTKKAEAMIKK